jgi:hypothetical protein
MLYAFLPRAFRRSVRRRGRWRAERLSPGCPARSPRARLYLHIYIKRHIKDTYIVKKYIKKTVFWTVLDTYSQNAQRDLLVLALTYVYACMCVWWIGEVGEVGGVGESVRHTYTYTYTHIHTPLPLCSFL